MHSVRIELAKLILVGTRITYQATGDAGLVHMCWIIVDLFIVRHVETVMAARAD